MGKNGIRKLVDDLVKKYKTNDPVKLCSYLNINIVEVSNVDIIGCTVKILDKTTILINKIFNQDEIIRILTLGHELCHGTYHELDDPLFMKQNLLHMTSRLEYEADFFSAYLYLHKGKDQKKFITEDDFIDKIENCIDKLKELRSWNI